MDWQALQQAAAYLGRQDDVRCLEKLRHMEENETFYLTVWGRFSAGKSKLLNRLLEQELLPVHTQEATAVPTYLLYGPQAKAQAWYEDGTLRELQAEELKEIWHSTENAACREELARMQCMEVQLPSPLLENGLVLVDTPGSNTTILRHREAAATAIEGSGCVLYVLDGAVTQEDAGWIRNIAEKGIQLIFVRTKCDRLNAAEEDPQETLAKEKKLLTELCQEEEIKFFAVSSEPDATNWASGMKALRAELEQQTKDVKKTIRDCCEARKEHIAEQCRAELDVRIGELEDARNGKTEELERRRRELEQQKKALEGWYTKRLKQFEEKEKNAQSQAEQTLVSEQKNMRDALSKKLAEIPPSKEYAQQAQPLYQAAIDDAVPKIEAVLYAELNRWVQEDAEELKTQLPAQMHDVPITYEQAEQESSELLEVYKKELQDLRAACEAKKQEIEAHQEEMTAYQQECETQNWDETIAAIDEELAKIPTEIAMSLVEENGIKPSEIFSKVGMAADLALFFLPGDAVVNGTKVVLDAAGATGKTAKVLTAARKALGASDTGKKILSGAKALAKSANKIDATKDLAWVLSKATDKGRYGKKQLAEEITDKTAETVGKVYTEAQQHVSDGSILDMLSIEYWARKIGQQFDPPPRFEIDVAVEQEKQRQRSELQQKKQKAMQDELDTRRKYRMFQNEQQALEWEKERKELIQKEIEEQMKEEQEQIRRTALENESKRVREAYLNCFEHNVEQLAQQLQQKFFAAAAQNIALYTVNQTRKMQQELEATGQRYSALLDQTEQQQAAHQTELDRCKKMREQIQ